MGSADKQDVWSAWFNTDRPWVGPGDFETVERIESLHDKICRVGYTIVGAQCRDLDSQVNFDQFSEDYERKEFLVRPCTTEGLECINTHHTDQGESSMCHDYAIRFKCKYTDDTADDSLFPQFDVRIYIILAVFPILIFLVRILWAYIFRRRRQRRRSARRQSAHSRRDGEDPDDEDTSSIASELANPPPSYNQIFGQRGNATDSSVFTISRENVPVCVKCSTTPCSVAFILKASDSESQRPSNPNPSGDSSASPLSSRATGEQQRRTETSSFQQSDSGQNSSMEEGAGGRSESVSEGVDGDKMLADSRSIASGSSPRPSLSDITSGRQHKKVQATTSCSTVVTYLEPRSELTPITERDSNAAAATNESASSSTSSSLSGRGSVPDCLVEVELEQLHSSPEIQPSSADLPQVANDSETTMNSSSISTDNNNDDNAGSTNQIANPSPATIDISSSSNNINMNTTIARVSEPLTTLFSPLDSLALGKSSISQPCACACHRTIPFEGRVVAEYDNAGFVHDDPDSERAPHLPGMHREVPGLHRVWSNLSVGSTITLSELPSYEDALELIKKKEAEAKNNSGDDNPPAY